MALQSTVFRSNWNLEMLVFVEGGKPEYLEKNPRSRDENQQQTQPAYDTETGNRSRSTLVGGECSHHCAIPAPIALILKENSFQFNERNYLRIHGTAMGTKMAVTFANIFMTDIETQIVCQSIVKPSVWKRYIDDIFSLWDTCKNDIAQYIWQANSYHPTIKFTAEIPNAEASFLERQSIPSSFHTGY